MKRISFIIIFIAALCGGRCLCRAAELPDSVSCMRDTAGPVLELTVEKCRELAMQNNAAVLNAGLDVSAAVAQKREAFAEYFPKVSVNALAFYAFDPLLEIGVTDILGHSDFTHNLQNLVESIAPGLGFSPYYSTLHKGVSASVMAVQPVFAGGRIVTGNRLAGLGVEAASLQQSIQLRKTREEVDDGYWQIVSLGEKMKALEEAGALLDTLYRDVLSASGAGLAVETDLLQVRMKMNGLKVGKISLENGIRLAKMNFFNSIGVDYNPYRTFSRDSVPYIDDIRLVDELPELLPPEDCYRPEDEVAMEQEEARLLDISVESGRLEKRMAVGETLPQIAVGASYGYNNFIDKGSMNGLVFGMVQIPISDWGKTARKMQRIDARIQKAENDRMYLQKQLELQIHKLWMDLTAAWEQVQVAQENRDLAEVLLYQMKEQYKAGMVAVSDLLQVQASLAQAESDLTDRKVEYRNILQEYLGRTAREGQ